MLQAVRSQKNILEKSICSPSQSPFASTPPGRGLVVVAREKSMAVPACIQDTRRKGKGKKRKAACAPGLPTAHPIQYSTQHGRPFQRTSKAGHKYWDHPKIKAAAEAPGSRLSSLPGLSQTSAECHPLLRVLGRGLQDPMPCRGHLNTQHAPPQQGDTALMPDQNTSISCCWTLV